MNEVAASGPATVHQPHRHDDGSAFRGALERAVAGGTAASPTPPTPVHAATAGAPITLGEMLGRPLRQLSSPAAATSGVRAFSAQVAGVGVVAPSQAAPAQAAPGKLLMPVAAPLTSNFGMRVHPITGVRRLHAGVDFGAPSGTPIRAAAGGTVEFSGSRGGYGNLVIIDHGNGLRTYYAHQRDLGVRTGERVAAHQVIGTVGSTGMSTGPHLHFEVRRGKEPVDPRPFLGLAASP